MDGLLTVIKAILQHGSGTEELSVKRLGAAVKMSGVMDCSRAADICHIILKFSTDTINLAGDSLSPITASGRILYPEAVILVSLDSIYVSESFFITNSVILHHRFYKCHVAVHTTHHSQINTDCWLQPCSGCCK